MNKKHRGKEPEWTLALRDAMDEWQNHLYHHLVILEKEKKGSPSNGSWEFLEMIESKEDLINKEIREIVHKWVRLRNEILSR
tara:strand:+ start:262 stop:507 length:246 start_codon:yes stop_codon:yes gene_type:complete